MAMKILSYSGNKNAHKALVAAQYGGVEIEEGPFEWGVTNSTEEFKKLTPIGKVPLLITPKGTLFESNAIARYVSRLGKDKEKLLGSDEWEQGQVDQWIDFANNELGGTLMKWATPICGFGEYDEKVISKVKVEAERALAALEKALTSADPELRLVGSSITLADIVTICELSVPWQCILSAEFMKPYPKVSKYVEEMLSQPEFKKVIGDITQAPEVPSGPLPPEKNPFFKPKRASEDSNGHPEEKEAKKSKVDGGAS